MIAEPALGTDQTTAEVYLRLAPVTVATEQRNPGGLVAHEGAPAVPRAVVPTRKQHQAAFLAWTAAEMDAI